MEKLRQNLISVPGRVALYVRALVKWVFISVVIGALSGLIGSVFHIGGTRDRAARRASLDHGPAAHSRSGDRGHL